VHIPKIHRVRIEKFRRIQEPLELDLTSPKGAPSKNIVLAGPNGCGKTSVLEAILLGLGRQDLIVRDAGLAAREERWRTNVPEGALIELDVSYDGGPVNTWFRANQVLMRRDESGQREIVVPSLPDTAVEYFSSRRAPELVGHIKPLSGRGNRLADTQNNRLWRLKQRVNDERAKGAYMPIPAGGSKADLWLDRINQAWRRFHGDDGTQIDAQIVDPDAEELFADLYVVREVSSGELELLSFAGWVITNDFKGGLLVIDEPELHLHPQWQATILPALRDLAPDAQFIVASHADAVWEQAYSFERFLLVPEGDPRSDTFRGRGVAASGGA
jgi:energy-coupling factor transporter ATP-binding protein EcfA2